MAKIKKRKIAINAGMEMVKEKYYSLLVGVQSGVVSMETSVEALYEKSIYQLCDPNVSIS